MFFIITKTYCYIFDFIFLQELGLLSDHNRLTVAVTRAKHKLIFVGDVQTLKGYAVFRKLFSLINSANIIKLPEESL